jgi:hypothetical protein
VCFIGAIVVGVVAQNPAGTIIWRAILVMVVSWVIGQSIGAVAQRTVETEIEQYKQARPLPPLSPHDVVVEDDLVPDEAAAPAGAAAQGVKA